MPFVFALLVEGPILIACERFPRERVLGLGLLLMGVSLLGCALAPNLLWFGAAFALYSPASGIACSIAQAALMDADPERREQRMTEWAVAGWIGDLGGPALLWLSDVAGFGYRGAFVAMGVLLAFAAWAFSRRPFSAEGEDEDEDELPLRETLRLLARQRLLFLWLSAVALCSLLDEIVAALIGVRVAPLGTSSVATSLVAFTLGGIVGLLPMNALLRRMSGVRVLVLSCLGCAVVYVAWLALPLWTSVPLLFVLGALTAPHYPLTQAQAYQALPERSTLVAAAGQPFMLVDIVLPLVVGFVADQAGVLWALLLLVAQPLGILGACWLEPRVRRSTGRR